MGMSFFGVYGKLRSQSHTAIQSSVEKERGIALVASLLLVVVVGIVGATVLETTSTEIKISGNYRAAVQNFYAAEAGIAEGQARLRGMQESGSGLIGDPVVGY
ncbi:MAG: PilX N-terminal domain-containing pilus assembly protein, partial [Nitrospirae bacterium]|nr:PilX N-terminal domain-containing pilus assembly protein [Nitrospirota bacterium]